MQLFLISLSFLSFGLTMCSSCVWLDTSCFSCIEPFTFDSFLGVCVSKTYYRPNFHLSKFNLNSENKLPLVSTTQICNEGYTLNDEMCYQCNPDDYYACNGMCVHIEYDAPTITQEYVCNVDSDDLLMIDMCYHCTPPKILDSSSLMCYDWYANEQYNPTASGKYLPDLRVYDP